MKVTYIALSLFLLFGCISPNKLSQNQDPDFIPNIEQPKYLSGEGPKVFIDEGHNNYHTMNGMYKPFANLLRSDGYRVIPHKGLFTNESLKQIDILVIANPIHESNINNWALPTPSAFSDKEIDNINNWVSEGGSLWLITDHMPIPGAAQKLASTFGFHFNNGHAHGPDNKRQIRFSRNKKTLKSHKTTNGMNNSERIEAVYTYSGHAFQVPIEAESLLEFESGSYSLNPNKAFKFDKQTPRIDISGWSQGAIRDYGSGRIVIIGESGLFTAQLAGENKKKVGMNSPLAPDNQQFALNIIHWLSENISNER